MYALSPASGAPSNPYGIHRHLDRVRRSPSFLLLRAIHPESRAYVHLLISVLSLVTLLNQFPSPATQLPPISSPPISPSQQAPREGTPLLGPCSSARAKQPRRHTVAGAHSHDHSHGLLPGHHRHEPHRQHDQHHSDHRQTVRDVPPPKHRTSRTIKRANPSCLCPIKCIPIPTDMATMATAIWRVYLKARIRMLGRTVQPKKKKQTGQSGGRGRSSASLYEHVPL